MDRDTLAMLTRAFINCEDLDEEGVREALRGFGLNPDEFLKLVSDPLDKAPEMPYNVEDARECAEPD